MELSGFVNAAESLIQILLDIPGVESRSRHAALSTHSPSNVGLNLSRETGALTRTVRCAIIRRFLFDHVAHKLVACGQAVRMFIPSPAEVQNRRVMTLSCRLICMQNLFFCRDLVRCAGGSSRRQEPISVAGCEGTPPYACRSRHEGIHVGASPQDARGSEAKVQGASLITRFERRKFLFRGGCGEVF